MTEPKIRFKRDDGSSFPDWEENLLKDITERIIVGLATSVTPYYRKTGIPILRNTNIKENYFDDTDMLYLDVDYAKQQKNKMVKTNDVLTVHTGSNIGLSCLVPLEYEGSLTFTTLITSPRESMLDSAFLCQYMNSNVGYCRMYALMTVGGKPNLNAGDLEKLKIPTPCFNEQQKIADFLSNVDEVIAASEEEVANLEQQKKAMIQKIFSQEVRFKKEDGSDFPDWEKKQLSDIFYKVNERNNGQFDKTKWISVAKMYYQEPDKVTSNNIDTRTYVMRKGDMAFEGHPNSEYKYGRFVVNDIGDGVISELFPIYRHKDEYVLNYWKYAIQIESIMSHIYRKAITSSGASSNKLDDNDFLREYLMIPSLPEQQKIADFLTSYDEAITAAKQELAKWKELKKGLLQQMFV